MNETISSLDKLSHWLNEWDYKKPIKYQGIKHSKFKQESRNAWAAKEVMEEVMRHPDENVFDVVERFRDQMDHFCCIAKTEEAKDIFIALYEVSTHALDYLIMF